MREPLAIVALIEWLRPSSIRMKRKGERGSPYLIPLDGEKGCDGTPLIRMEKKAEKVRVVIQLT